MAMMCLVLETPNSFQQKLLFHQKFVSLQCSDNDFRGGDVSRSVWYAPEK